MARRAREKSSTGIYAISLKGTGDIFKKRSIKEIFEECCERYLGENLLAVKIERDSAEMLVKESDKGISLDMKPLITSFARQYNKETGNDGKVFSDRFKSIPVEDDEIEDGYKAYLNGEKGGIDLFKPTNARTVKKAESAKTSDTIKKTKNTKVQSVIDDTVPETVETVKPAKEPEAKPEEKSEEKPKARRNQLPTWLL